MVVNFGDIYTGPPFFGNDDNGRRAWLPIYPENYEWYKSRRTPNSTSETETECDYCKRLPLRLYYAWNIWKSQGQTMCTNFFAYFEVTEK